MKEIEEFKKENVNITYTVKELLGGLHKKFDKLADNQISTNKKVAKLWAWSSVYKWAFGVVSAVLLKLIFF